MKRKLIILTALAIMPAALLFNGCKKDDTTPPVVTLNGSSSMTLTLNATQPTDPGATANDDKDGAITPTSDWSSTNPNMNMAGTYTITYSASDKAGNTGTATRTVIVQNAAAYLAGTYTDSIYSNATLDTVFTQTITASSTVNNRITFSKFGDYANNNAIYATVAGTTVDITAQSATGIGLSGCNHDFSPSGSGQAITTVGGKNRFSVKYTDTELNTSSSCTGTTAIPVEEVFVQQ